MSSGEHIGELAELYAIGALGESERRDVERHVAGCTACGQRLGEAEDDVAAMEAARLQHDPPEQLQRRVRAMLHRPAGQWSRYAPAVAAALILGLLPSAFFWEQNRTMHAAMEADSAAIGRVASTPHRSVAFSQMSDGSAASVMYGPDGSWYVVLVRGASRALSVAWMHDGQRTMLGTATPHGDVAMLYLPKSHRMNQLALMDGDRVVAQAQLAY
ncbi:MAG: hypothetical protein JO029_15830 [Candidatus Eremiobacteraeota bacterium]|nr:hypothetical protein [Candidatus Eremiobacteraeota bacterium]MBV8285015.1 hypothetical protein [Candidatus Eremiobacteraeota bacterium]MBV8331359.1 hypothetical protein [Candidatus Eremiobacteraeota bacterium]MBV8435751.1 hypothetical protein [Candidatus Eremiobacteraeota bacterium]MBV8582859.1 hypothetical protein [Candidatus Eremiobacteraeota bacterium]